MLSKDDAIVLAQQALPDRRIEFYLQYKGLYIIQAFDDSDPDEGDYDPFYSVDFNTGEIKEFSVITDANRVELTNLWLAANT